MDDSYRIINGQVVDDDVDADFNKSFFQRLMDYIKNLIETFRRKFILR